MSNILITGATGFIGSNITRKLANSENRLILFIKQDSNLWRLNDVTSKCEVHKVDLLEAEHLTKKIKTIKPDIVFHCASYGVLSYQKDANLIIQTNVTGTNNLMNALVETGSVRKFINLGSTFEYGPKCNDILETEIPEPVSLYGITKVAQTNLARYFALQRGLPTLTLRIFTPYGPYEQTGRLIPNIIQSIIKKKTLDIISPKAKRDFIYIDDVVTAMIKAAKSRFVNGEIFNIGNGKEYSVEEIIHIAEKITGDKLKVNFTKGKEREFDKFGKFGFANIEKAKKLRWRPTHSINEGMVATYQWFKENIRLYR